VARAKKLGEVPPLADSNENMVATVFYGSNGFLSFLDSLSLELLSAYSIDLIISQQHFH
jgi:hypothetical protein